MIASPAKTGMRSPPELVKWLIRPVALVDIKGMAKAAPAVPAGYLHPVLARRPTVSVLVSTRSDPGDIHKLSDWRDAFAAGLSMEHKPGALITRAMTDLQTTACCRAGTVTER